MKKLTLLAASLLTGGFVMVPALANDWPQWGGRPQRNMYSEEKGLPDKFEPGKLKSGTEEVDLRTTKNVK